MENSSRASYKELTRLVRQQGLLDRQPAYYAGNVVVILGLLALSIAIIITVESFWLQLLNAILMAFVFGQIGFLGHDSGHREIFASARKNDIFGLVVSFFLGIIRTWWVDKHNRHHSNPNQVGLDPDIDIPVISFTREDALGKRGFFKFLVKFQAIFIVPLVCLESVALRVVGVQYMSSNRLKYSTSEPLLMLLHFAIYFSLLFWFLDVWQAALFVVVHQLAFGFYMGSVFATNHKGMPIIDSDSTMNFLMRQILTARNVRGNVVIDTLMGGLNYQIEHHLFPTMPRNQLRKAQKIVKAYCADHEIDYYETDFLRSYKEILKHFHWVGAVLRKPVVMS